VLSETHIYFNIRILKYNDIKLLKDDLKLLV